MIYCYRVRASAAALEDIKGAIDVPFFARRVGRWGGLWTFDVVTGNKSAFERWARSSTAIHSWGETTGNYAASNAGAH